MNQHSGIIVHPKKKANIATLFPIEWNGSHTYKIHKTHLKSHKFGFVSHSVDYIAYVRTLFKSAHTGHKLLFVWYEKAITGDKWVEAQNERDK